MTEGRSGFSTCAITFGCCNAIAKTRAQRAMWGGGTFIANAFETFVRRNARVCFSMVFDCAEDAEPAEVSDHLEAARFLGERIRELRRTHGLTQEQAAALIGMEYKYYQMIEWGRKNLRMDTMARIAKAYHLEVWDLVQHSGLPPSRVKKLRQVVPAPHRPAQPRGRAKSAKKS